MSITRYMLAICLTITCAVASAQHTRTLEEQRKVVEELEKKVAAEAREIANLQKGRTTTEKRVQSLIRQIDTRNQLLDETREQATLLSAQIAHTDSVGGDLQQKLGVNRAQYAEMAREAYRNYKYNNYLTYIFSARDFSDMAGKIAVLRNVASMRERKLQDIATLSERVAQEQQLLARQKQSLDSVTRKVTAQKQTLERDTRNARTEIKHLSQRETRALRQKIDTEQQLNVEEAKLSEMFASARGNDLGTSFSAKTRGLRLPVAGGKIAAHPAKNMLKITGPAGAQVNAVYDGKVVRVEPFQGNYLIFVAHGETYLTSYIVRSPRVENGQNVARNQHLGAIVPVRNLDFEITEHRLIFAIYSSTGTLDATTFFTTAK